MTLLVRQGKQRACAAQRGFPGSGESSGDQGGVLALVVHARLAPGGRPEPRALPGQPWGTTDESPPFATPI
jgi:hypothetical protein